MRCLVVFFDKATSLLMNRTGNDEAEMHGGEETSNWDGMGWVRCRQLTKPGLQPEAASTFLMGLRDRNMY